MVGRHLGQLIPAAGRYENIGDFPSTQWGWTAWATAPKGSSVNGHSFP